MIQFVLGGLSYTAAAIILVVDSMVYYGIHWPLRFCADKFLSDGDNLTGWNMKDVKSNG